jgi:hypothetical protein
VLVPASVSPFALVFAALRPRVHAAGHGVSCWGWAARRVVTSGSTESEETFHFHGVRLGSHTNLFS